MTQVLQLIARDVAELPLLLVVVGLPLVLGVMAVRARSRSGWAALVCVAALLGLYVAVYAVPLPNPGAARGVLVAVSVSLFASALALTGYLRSRTGGVASQA